jgi:phosphoglycolate phosphatase-like HAD superfamily hydrolase
MISNRKLLLWDIDGTLIMGDRAGERALIASLKNTFGVDGSLDSIELAGRTDKLIAVDVLRAYDIEPTHEAIHDYLEGYLAQLAAQLSQGKPQLHPGILAALEAVAARTDLAQGLLTGNLVRGARIKLEHFAVWNYFPFGAFADDSAIRDELGPHAIKRAGTHHEYEFLPERTFVIGDTPHDIQCGKAIGAATVALATGLHSAETLRACNPTVVFRDLADTAAFLKFIDGHPAGEE